MSAAWATVVVSIVVGAVGLYLGNSLRRQARAARDTEAIEKRFEIYAKLWRATQPVAPMDMSSGRRRFTEARRRALFDELTTWYFEHAGGMVLGEPARTMYLVAKANLGARDWDELYPESVRECVMMAEPLRREEVRTAVVVRQLSLLRTAMRADLGIFGEVYGEPLSPLDRDFLRNCRAPTWRKPWRDGARGEWISDWYWRPAQEERP